MSAAKRSTKTTKPVSEPAVEEPAAETPAVEAPAPTDGEEAAEPRDPRRKWYVIHTYSGYENKVKANLEHRIESMGVRDKIFQVVIPTEEEIEIKDGQRRTVQRKVFPGYVLVDMIMDDDSWYVVRNTPGVTGFVGAGTRPTPLEDAEVKRILKQMKQVPRRMSADGILEIQHPDPRQVQSFRQPQQVLRVIVAMDEHRCRRLSPRHDRGPQRQPFRDYIVRGRGQARELGPPLQKRVQSGAIGQRVIDVERPLLSIRLHHFGRLRRVQCR